MEVKATAKYIRVQPRKVRIIADEVRGKNALYTCSLLRYHTSKSAKLLAKVLVSAMANAQENHGIAPEALKIRTILVDEGPRLKRMRARAMGRGNRIVKKTSHITVVVEDAGIEKPIKPHGTKPKPRPTFGTPKSRRGAGTSKAQPEDTIVEVVAPVVEEVVEQEVAPVEAMAEVIESPIEASTAVEAEDSAEKGDA